MKILLCSLYIFLSSVIEIFAGTNVVVSSVNNIDKLLRTEDFNFNNVVCISENFHSPNINGVESGTFWIQANFCTNRNVIALKNIFVSMLDLRFSSLDSLQGIEKQKKLRYLDLTGSNISDISLLRGLSLDYLSLFNTSVSNITSLANSPIKTLVLAMTEVNDLTALKGETLELLDIGSTNIKDLSSLENSPVRSIGLSYLKIEDLSPLTNSPIVGINIWGCNNITNQELILSFELETIFFDPKHTKENVINGLRNMKTLRSINNQSTNMFWQRYDSGDFN
ncbi:MAG: hypothetical protein PF692_05645 [Kiritimatiellae bacterium]|jgi:hypothetical protein|nr:hypothetical protein [Kiritimatiellia bacterium]